MTQLRKGLLILLASTSVTGSCAYPRTKPLAGWSLADGYRFTRVDSNRVSPTSTLAERRTGLEKADRLFVVLSFSGGGTRAAALAYGVLAQLEAVRIHVNADGNVVQCRDWESAACRALERSLLDEVDVISSVSGGSFTSAYYALRGKEIFDETGAFHRRFLRHNVQGDLLRSLFLNPRNWLNLGSRVEIAARYYQKHIFGAATFRDLERRPRPFIVINADDMSTGNRFEFTQDQFDLLCGDLAAFPVARAVTASSAFPGLLNSMTIDSNNGTDPAVSPCGYAGPGSPHADEDARWVEDVLGAKYLNRPRYRAALALRDYRDAKRRHLHLLDGGLADNVGLRAVSEALSSGDRLSQAWAVPDQLNFEPDAGRLVGGWSLQQLINEDRIGTLLVITVNARTEKTTDWDSQRRGPSTLDVLKASSGTPMGHFSNETVDRIQEHLTAIKAQRKASGRLPFDAYTFEVAFDDISDTLERQYFLNLPTSFSLTAAQANCLIAKAPVLLRASSALNTATDDGGPMTFERVTTEALFAKVNRPPTPLATCK